MTSTGSRSCLIIEVPEAEPAVAQHREHLDASAPLGIPAHITVLSPFMPPGTIDPAALAELEHLFAAVSRSHFQLDHTDWFGDEVLWLAPRDPGPFRTLTKHVYKAFPAFPPFEGQFDDVVPHLTVGHGHPVNDLRAAEEAVASGFTSWATGRCRCTVRHGWVRIGDLAALSCITPAALQRILLPALRCCTH